MQCISKLLVVVSLKLMKGLRRFNSQVTKIVKDIRTNLSRGPINTEEIVSVTSFAHFGLMLRPQLLIFHCVGFVIPDTADYKIVDCLSLTIRKFYRNDCLISIPVQPIEERGMEWGNSPR